MTGTKRPLSERPLGYFIAVLGGTIAAPLGWVTSPLALLILSKAMISKDGKTPNRFKRWALVGIIGAPLSLAPFIYLGAMIGEQDLAKCNSGLKDACERLVYTPDLHPRVTNPYFKDLMKKAAQEEKRKSAEEARLSKEKAAVAAKKVEQGAREWLARDEAKRAKINADELAKAARFQSENDQKVKQWMKNSMEGACENAAKAKARDPDSYIRESDFSILASDENNKIIQWSFRSKNGFGGYNKLVAWCSHAPEDGANFRIKIFGD